MNKRKQVPVPTGHDVDTQGARLPGTLLPERGVCRPTETKDSGGESKGSRSRSGGENVTESHAGTRSHDHPILSSASSSTPQNRKKEKK